MILQIRQFFLVVLFFSMKTGFAQVFEGCKGTPNNQTLIVQKPQLVGRVDNGYKYTVPYDGRYFYILDLHGSAYQMGFAQGQLMKEEIAQFLPQFWQFAEWIIENNVSKIITKMPTFIKSWIANTTVSIARGLLDLNWLICEPYTPPRFDQELQGLADATGNSIWEIRQVNLIPELLKASCSILGAYGKSTTTNRTFHLRTLDWEEHSPMSRWPQITVYHSIEAGSVPFANIGWPVLIGSLTGYNAAKVGIGQRLGNEPLSTQTRKGTPFTYVLRDVLQFSWNENEAITRLQNAKRTCSMYLGVGGLNYFEIAIYTADYLNVYNWTNWLYDEWHPRFEDVLWKAYKDDNSCFKNIIQANYGNVSAEVMYRQIAPMGKSGDSQVIVMDYQNDVMYCMYPNPNTFNPGYNSPPISIDLKPFFTKQNLD